MFLTRLVQVCLKDTLLRVFASFISLCNQLSMSITKNLENSFHKIDKLFNLHNYGGGCLIGWLAGGIAAKLFTAEKSRPNLSCFYFILSRSFVPKSGLFQEENNLFYSVNGDHKRWIHFLNTELAEIKLSSAKELILKF